MTFKTCSYLKWRKSLLEVHLYFSRGKRPLYVFSCVFAAHQLKISLVKFSNNWHKIGILLCFASFELVAGTNARWKRNVMSIGGETLRIMNRIFCNCDRLILRISILQQCIFRDMRHCSWLGCQRGCQRGKRYVHQFAVSKRYRENYSI